MAKERSSYALAVLAALAVVLSFASINLFGPVVDSGGVNLGSGWMYSLTVEHGWPFAFAVRSMEMTEIPNVRELWLLNTPEIDIFYGRAVFIDVASALIVTACTFVTVNKWCIQHDLRLKFGFQTLLAFIAAVACWLSLYRRAELAPVFVYRALPIVVVLAALFPLWVAVFDQLGRVRLKVTR